MADSHGPYYSEHDNSPKQQSPRKDWSPQEQRWRDFASGMVILVLSYATLLACALGWWFTR